MLPTEYEELVRTLIEQLDMINPEAREDIEEMNPEDSGLSPEEFAEQLLQEYLIDSTPPAQRETQNNEEELNMNSELEENQQEEQINPIVGYLRLTSDVPEVEEVEVDKDVWKIKNSQNYDKFNPDWKEEYKNNELDMKLDICSRCGTPLRNNSYRWSSAQIRTLCKSCLESDADRLTDAFEEKWGDVRFTLTRRGKEARVANIRAKYGPQRNRRKLPEDLEIDYKLEYVDSGIGCNSEYDLDDIYDQWKVGLFE